MTRRHPVTRRGLELMPLEPRLLLDGASSGLGDALSSAAEYAPDTILIGYESSVYVSAADVASQLAGASVLHAYRSFPGAVVQLPEGMSVPDAVAYFSSLPGVAFAEPDYYYTLAATTPNDPSYSSLWGLNNTGQTGGTVDADIDAPEAWDITTGSASVVVGIIDTGIDVTHPDLMANIWVNPGEIAGNGIDDDGNGYVDDINGWNFVEYNNDISDGYGHGTHVAGTIGAVGNNSIGLTGVCWTVKLAGIRIFDDYGGATTSSLIAEGIEYATLMGFSITNNSWGGGDYSTAIYNAIAGAGAQGYLFVAAAGNDSTNNDTLPEYPGSYNLNNIIAVASTTHTDGLSSFSNYGATTVDLGAPGSDILSTLPVAGSVMGSTYGTASGTSMATPHVAGVAALLKAADPTLSALDIKALILDNVDVKSSLSGKVLTGGRLNAYNAIHAISAPTVTGHTPTGIVFTTAPAYMDFNFSRAMDTSSFALLDDVVSFTGPTGSLVGTLTGFTWRNGNTTLRINFSAPTVDGVYTMVIGPNILSAGGKAMDQDGDGTPGETVQDRYTGSFTYDAIIPTVSVALQAASDSGVSNSDRITNDTTPSYNVVVNKGGTITVDFDGDGIIDRTEVVASSGTYVFTPPTAQSDGAKTMRATLTDSVGIAVSALTTVTIDTQAPVVTNLFGNVLLFTDDFSSDLGWTGYATGQWARGSATAGGGQYGNPDPSADASASDDNAILGYAIGGDYQNLIGSTRWITSPVIDCSNASGVTLNFQRWLNVEAPKYDKAVIEVYDGTAWRQIFINTAAITDNAWTAMTYDVSQYADGNAQFRVRFGMGSTDLNRQYSGWNLDDVQVVGMQALADTLEMGLVSLGVAFSDANALDTSTITLPANYGLAAAGGDGGFTEGNEEDLSGLLGAISYNAAAKRVTIPLTSALTGDLIRLLVNQSGTIRDVAGNVMGGGAPVAALVQVDAALPSVSTVLQAASDTGLSNSDRITRDNTPAYDVTVNKSGVITVDWDNNGTIDLTLAVSSAGVYAITPVSSLSDGTYPVAIRFTGASGISATATVPTTIDTAAPAAPTGLALSASDDTGLLGDHVTCDSTPVLTFSKPSGAYYRFYRDGALISEAPILGDDGGLYGQGSSIQLADQGAGHYSYTVTSVDAAGNESAPSAAYVLQITSVCPVATYEYADGVFVTLYDVDPANGLIAPRVAWTKAQFRKDATNVLIDKGTLAGLIKSVEFYGTDAEMRDLGIVIENVGLIGKVVDRRTVPTGLGFFYSDGAIGTMTLLSAVTGANINGLTTESGRTLAADLDGDGSLADLTGIFSGNAITSLTLKGAAQSDIIAVRDLTKLSASAIAADVRVGGSMSSLASLGILSGNVSVGGGLGKLTCGGSLTGAVNVLAGDLGSAQIGGSMDGAAISAANGLIKTVRVKGDFTSSSLLASTLGNITVGGVISDPTPGDSFIRALDPASSFKVRDRNGAATISSGYNHFNANGVEVFVGVPLP